MRFNEMASEQAAAFGRKGGAAAGRAARLRHLSRYLNVMKEAGDLDDPATRVSVAELSARALNDTVRQAS